MSEGIGPGVLLLFGRQENDVDKASDGVKALRPEDGGLNLAVDVLSQGVAGT